MSDEDYKSEEQMLGEMLQHGHMLFAMETGAEGTAVTIAVNCNDLFYWACADAEDLPYEEIANLYRMWKADPKYGADRWACLRRKLAPQKPVEKRWREHGTWDAEMDALPKPGPS